VADDDIDVEISFMRLVDDHCIIAPEKPVPAYFRNEDPVGLKKDAGIGPDAFVESGPKARHCAKGGAQIVGNFFGDGCRGDPARLRYRDSSRGTKRLEAEKGKLRGFTAARFSRYHNDLMLSYRGDDFFAICMNRQVDSLRKAQTLLGTVAGDLHEGTAMMRE
jgi:hypothetical protein